MDAIVAWRDQLDEDFRMSADVRLEVDKEKEAEDSWGDHGLACAAEPVALALASELDDVAVESLIDDAADVDTSVDRAIAGQVDMAAQMISLILTNTFGDHLMGRMVVGQTWTDTVMGGGPS